MRQVRNVKGGRYNATTTAATVARDVGALPGHLHNVPLTVPQRGALKYFLRRWCGMSKADIDISVDALRRAYDTRGLDVYCGDSAPAPVPNPVPSDGSAEGYAREQAEDAARKAEIIERQRAESNVPMPESNAPMPTSEDVPMTPTPAPNGDLAHALKTLGQFMGAAPIDESAVRAIVAEAIANAPAKNSVGLLEITLKRPDLPDVTTGAAPRHVVFAELLAAVAAGENVLLVGPAGSGKTHICEQVAEALGLPFSFNGAIGSEYKLSGFIDAQGRYQATAYRISYENGGVHLWDELDGSSANAVLYGNAGLANGQQDFPNGVVKRHPDNRIVASANTYGHGADRQYVGRNQLDAASLDRFYVLPMDYDEQLERALYGDNDWTAFVQRVRAAVRALQIRHVVSMRAIASGHRALAAGIARKSVERATVWKHLGDAEIAKIRAHMRESI